MAKKRTELGDILRRLADYVDQCQDKDLVSIVQRAISPADAVETKVRSWDRSESCIEPSDVQSIYEELRTLPSREAGHVLLREKVRTKAALEAIARSLQLPMQREDTVDRLRTKIVEHTIGARLRSDAIQGRRP